MTTDDDFQRRASEEGRKVELSILLHLGRRRPFARCPHRGPHPAAAALRYQHVIDGQDAEIVDYLERFGEEPSASATTRDDRSMADPKGHVVGTDPDPTTAGDLENPGNIGGGDGNRTHDPLLAKQVL